MHNLSDRDGTDTEPHAWLVIVNAERQHALWPVTCAVPDGWVEQGPEGRREDCLAWVDQHWTDMRPLSLRQP